MFRPGSANSFSFRLPAATVPAATFSVFFGTNGTTWASTLGLSGGSGGSISNKTVGTVGYTPEPQKPLLQVGTVVVRARVVRAAKKRGGNEMQSEKNDTYEVVVGILSDLIMASIETDAKDGQKHK